MRLAARQLLMVALVTVALHGCLRLGFQSAPNGDGGADTLADTASDQQALLDAAVCQHADAGQGQPQLCSSGSGWCWEQPTAYTSNRLNGVWQGTLLVNGQARDRTFAVGDRGTFLMRINNAWKPPEILSDSHLFAAIAVGDQILAAGNSAIWTFNGSNWSKQDIGDRTVRAFLAENGEVYAVGQDLEQDPNQAIVFRRVAGGMFVEDASFPEIPGALTAVAGHNGLIVVAGGVAQGSSIAYRLVAGTWEPVPGVHNLPNNTWLATWVGEDDLAQPVSFFGGINTATNTRLFKVSGSGAATIDIPCSAGNECRVASITGRTLDGLVVANSNAQISVVNGQTFQLTTSLPPIPFSVVQSVVASATSPNEVTVVGGGGTIFRYDGVQWEQQGNPERGFLWGGHSIDLGGAEATLVPGDMRALWRFGESRWSSGSGPPQGAAAWLNGPCDAWIGAEGGLYRFTDRWRAPPELPVEQRLTLPETGSDGGVSTGINVFDLWGTGADDLWAVGRPGIWHWDGAAWSNLVDLRDVDCGPTGLVGANAVWGSGNEAIVVGGCIPGNGTGFVYRCEATSCLPLVTDLPDVLLGVWGINGQYIAVGSSNIPGGIAYREISSTMVGPALSPNLPGRSGQQFLSVTGTSLNNIWAGTDQGHVAHFDGTTWTSVPTVASSPLLSLWLTADATKLYAGGLYGTLISKLAPLAP